MWEKTKIEVPVRWILGDPELADEFSDFETGDDPHEWESPNCNYSTELVLDLAEQSKIEPDDIVAKVYLYRDLFEVLVLESRATKREVVSYLMFDRSEYHGQSLRSLEEDLAREISTTASIESIWW